MRDNDDKHSECSETSTRFYPGLLQVASQITEMYTSCPHWWRFVALVGSQRSVLVTSYMTYCVLAFTFN